MKTRLTIFSVPLLVVGWLVAGPAQAQVLFDEDLEFEFPGEGQPAFVGFTFVGDSTSDMGGTTPVTLTQETSLDGVDGSQAYKLTLDTTDALDYHYGGVGVFPTGFNALILDGALGTTNPSNYVYSFDLRVEGAVPENPVPLRGEVAYFEPDYELETGIDINDDGLFDQGADSYVLPLNFTANAEGFTTNTFTLDQGSGPAVNLIEGQNPYFSNQGTLVLRWFWDAGEFGFDNDNVITIDNIKLEFVPPTVVAGDYNADGVVNAADYTVWRDRDGGTFALFNEGEGVTPGEVTQEDYTFWASQYGSTGGGSLAVPEPTAGLIALGGLAAALGRRSRR